MHELAKAKKALEQLLEEQKLLLEETEDELQVVEDAKLRLEVGVVVHMSLCDYEFVMLQVNLQAAKTNFERELGTKEEKAEESRRNLIKQLRDLESQVEEERKGRTMAQSAAKKIESELAELESQIEAESKGKEDALRMYKKVQASVLHIVLLRTCHSDGCVCLVDSTEGCSAWD